MDLLNKCGLEMELPFRGRNSFLGGENVTHWTFANGKVRVFDLCSEFFQIFWRVVDSVPTYGSYPEICGLKLCTKTQKRDFWFALGLASAGLCTGTALMVVPEHILYRYTLMVVPIQKTVFCQPEPRGARKLVGIFVGANEGRATETYATFHILDMMTWDLRRTYTLACQLCSFAHACEGRSPQAGTPEIAIATHARSYGIGRRSGMPWGRLIPGVGMLTTTGPLGTAQARQHTGVSSVQTAYEPVLQDWNLKSLPLRERLGIAGKVSPRVSYRGFGDRHMAGLGMHRAGLCRVPGRDTRGVITMESLHHEVRSLKKKVADLTMKVEVGMKRILEKLGCRHDDVFPTQPTYTTYTRSTSRHPLIPPSSDAPEAGGSGAGAGDDDDDDDEDSE
uniref:Uncharacterized protein n=1 Tax=Ananas comosus var. bracteatus TaxID=296719 RepID=A0A6V7PY95_ANACO|nr:unnamed protein product [Ananas comosus var. bracteatus]